MVIRQTDGSSWLAWCDGWQPHGVVYSSDELPSELTHWLCHDDSTRNNVNIVLVVRCVVILVTMARGSVPLN